MPGSTIQEWKSFIEKCPDAHVLQSTAWGELKSKFGWDTSWIIAGTVGAQVLFQALPFGFHIAYIPRGPVSTTGTLIGSPDWDEFQGKLHGLCREKRTVFLKIEPDLWDGEPAADCSPLPGYRTSSHSIQPPRTIVISLQESEEEILARMKSKTRYNIRLAEKKEVSVRQLEQIEPFYKLLENTSDRSEFGIHTLEYYREAFNLFDSTGECKLFQAEFQGEPLASIMVFIRGNRSWYFYGASSNKHRDRMPTYLVQWEAMRWAKSQGCLSYDLWGVPDERESTLEDHFMERHDGLWGIYRFKRGFGGDLKRTCGPWDKVFYPGLYSLYLLRSRIMS